MASIISTKTSGGGGIAVTGDTSGVMQLASNDGTTAVTIDASQNVGIGTASPNATLNINKTNIINGTVFLNGATTSPDFIRIKSTSADCVLGVESSTGGTIVVGSSPNSTVLYTTNSTPLQFGTNGSIKAAIDTSGNLQFNSGYGSVATAYGCRAWVNFNGTGTVAIRASGNVSSITDNGTGDYTVNLTNAMPDVNYSTFLNVGRGTSATSSQVAWGPSTVNPTTSAFRFVVINSSFSLTDAQYGYAAFFR
jgi:hypothetical protein